MDKTQLRATCPACFAEQAIRGGRMVQHGYRRPQGWNANVGNCSGVHKFHFGTHEGRSYTAGLAAGLRKQAEANRTAAATPASLPVFRLKRIASGVNTRVLVENPTPADQAQEARRLDYEAKAMEAQAAEFEGLVAAWTPKEPIEAAVETRTTLIHAYSKGYGGKACAGSRMGAMRGVTTDDPAKVTCAKCQARLARAAEQRKA